MAEEPFWPSEKNSSASSTSVRCRWRISVATRSTEAATTPSVAKYMAWRSRGMTWVEIGSTFSPMAFATWVSTRGSTCANVPTAPEIAQVATSSRAATSRAISRSEEHTSELQSRLHLVCRLLLEKKNTHKTKFKITLICLIPYTAFTYFLLTEHFVILTSVNSGLVLTGT